MVGHWGDVQRDAEVGTAVHRRHRRPGERMTSASVFSGLVALGAGATAVVIAVLLVRTIFA